MTEQEIKGLIEAGIPESEAMVQGDGRHFEVIVVSEAFGGKSMVQKQRMVLALLNQHITSGVLHAVSIKTYLPAEWDKVKALRIQ